MKTIEEKAQLAREAFWGKREALYEHCLTVQGYVFAGVTCDANGLDLSECIEAVQLMGDEEIDECIAIDG